MRKLRLRNLNRPFPSMKLRNIFTDSDLPVCGLPGTACAKATVVVMGLR
jgi:hypothetical protein